MGSVKVRKLSSTLSRMALTTVILFRGLSAKLPSRFLPDAIAHTMPSPNMAKISSFCLFLRFSHRTFVAGSKSIHTSSAMLTAE